MLFCFLFSQSGHSFSLVFDFQQNDATSSPAEKATSTSDLACESPVLPRLMAVPFSVVPSHPIQFPRGPVRLSSLALSEQERWAPWINGALQPPLPASPLRTVKALARWRCPLALVFSSLFGNRPREDNYLWVPMK